jgi:multiple antibiotic resistance protein
MNEFSFFHNFVGLFAVANPIGNLPLYLGLIAGKTAKENTRTITTTAIAFSIILCVSLFLGEAILDAFGITVDSFRVAGGFLIFLMGLNMLHAKSSVATHTKEEHQEAQQADSIAIVPLAIPILAGPGTISTVIVYAHNSPSLVDKMTEVSVIVALAVVIYVLYRSAPLINRALGKTGMNIVTRIMGLITMAIAVQFMADGLKALFPAWQ